MKYKDMNRKSRIIAELLLHLKKQHGDLNTALVIEFVRAYGSASVRGLSQDLGLNRSVIRRALQGMSESDIGI